jgi:hypothetical protein
MSHLNGYITYISLVSDIVVFIDCMCIYRYIHTIHFLLLSEGTLAWLQAAAQTTIRYIMLLLVLIRSLQHIAAYCNILQHIGAYCNILQHIATYCSILQYIATYCSILQNIATYCNILPSYGKAHKYYLPITSVNTYNKYLLFCTKYGPKIQIAKRCTNT